jgi:hypothetical protein
MKMNRTEFQEFVGLNDWDFSEADILGHLPSYHWDNITNVKDVQDFMNGPIYSMVYN